MMSARSLLFVPADSERKLAKGLASGADALILDLEDSVAAGRRPVARGLAREFLSTRRASAGPELWVRINPVGSPDSLPDLVGVIAAAPDGLVVPKVEGPAALRILDHYLTALEHQHGLPPGGVKLLSVATETPAAVLGLSEYRTPPPRLTGLTWGAEDLSAELGASTNRDEAGGFAFTYRVARSLCLLAARAGDVAAYDGVYADYRDGAGLEVAAVAAQREGFDGMLAIHPDQAPIINAAFQPSEADLAFARRVVAAFTESEGGVIGLEGKMLDMPHLKQAEKVLRRADRS